MFERYDIQSVNIQNPSLQDKLEHFNITIKTSYQVNKEASASSFFNKLSLPAFEGYVYKKVKDEKFSFTEWKDKEQELKKSYSKVVDFKSKKSDEYHGRKYQEALDNMKDLLTTKEKLLLLIFSDRYNESQSRHSWEEVTIKPLTLDNYLEFYADTKIGFSTENILGRVSTIFWNKTNENDFNRGRATHVPMFSLLRLISMCSEDANNDLIETSYNLQNSPELLRLILKSNKDLQSFRTDPKRLIKLIQYDDKHYGRYCSSVYSPKLKLKKEQAVEFAKFYLKSTDKRLNCSNLISELVLHLRKHDENELISELVLSHHRVFSSVIAGKITMDSYSSDARSFLRHVLSTEGYRDFKQLIEDDENERFNNAIKISMN